MKNAKKNNQVVVAEQDVVVEKKSAKKSTKPVEKSTKTPAKKTKPVEKSVKVKTAKKTKASGETTTKSAKSEKKPQVSVYDKLFPAHIDLEGEALDRCGHINSFGEFRKLFEDAEESGRSVFVACYWPKKYAKDYEASYNVRMPKSGFKDNLDICEVQFFQQTIERALAVSVLSEAICTIHAEDVVRNEDGIIIVNDVECEFYITRAEK